MSDKTRVILLVGVDGDECDAGYAVVREDTYNEWNSGALDTDEQSYPDHFSLFYGATGLVDTFDNFAAAMTHIAEMDGELVDVHGAIAY